MLKKGVERTLSKVGIQSYKDQKNNYFITCRRRTWLKNSYYSLFLFFPEETKAAFHIDTVSCQRHSPKRLCFTLTILPKKSKHDKARKEKTWKLSTKMIRISIKKSFYLFLISLAPRRMGRGDSNLWPLLC